MKRSSFSSKACICTGVAAMTFHGYITDLIDCSFFLRFTTGGGGKASMAFAGIGLGGREERA